MLFNELELLEPIQKALIKQGYTKTTPIQKQAIPVLLEGADLLGCAQTGTGKTAAFSIPILQNLSAGVNEPKGKRPIKALIVAPTRELAIQIGDSFRAYGRNLSKRTLMIYGGVGQTPQTRKLEQGVDILVATPGRLLDLIHQGYVDLGQIEHFVLDEADQMLDMGMLQDVKKILKFLPKDRQNMFFSATMPDAIENLADTILKDPVKIEIKPEYSPIDIIEQKVYFVDKVNKTKLLVDVLKETDYDSVIVFSRTKYGADKIVRVLEKNRIAAVAIHGNKSQTRRQQALKDFKDRKVRVMVATDIAARGLDISELSHVINFNLCEVPETYVHRIGRTGRAGLGGVAISFCDFEEKKLLNSIEKLIDKKLPVVKGHSYPLVNTTIEPKPKRGQRPQRKNQGNMTKGKKAKTDASGTRKKSSPSKDRNEKSKMANRRKTKTGQQKKSGGNKGTYQSSRKNNRNSKSA